MWMRDAFAYALGLALLPLAAVLVGPPELWLLLTAIWLIRGRPHAVPGRART